MHINTNWNVSVPIYETNKWIITTKTHKKKDYSEEKIEREREKKRYDIIMTKSKL